MKVDKNLLFDKNSLDEYYMINANTGAKFTIHIAQRIFCLCPDNVTEGDAKRAEIDNMDIWRYVGKNVDDAYMNIFRIFVEEYVSNRFSVNIIK